MNDLVKEAKKWIEIDHILCADGYELAEEIIPALLNQLETLQKFYNSVQRSMNDHKQYSNLLDDINQATEEYHET